MKNFLCLIILVLTFSSCLLNFDEYPSKYYDYEWSEISKDDALEIWNNYDTTSKLYDTAKVYKDYPKRGYVILNCNVEKKNDNFYLLIMAETLKITFSFSENDDYNIEDVKFFTCKEDSSLVKIVGGANWWDSRIFSNGWLVECRKDADYDHEYYYILYND